MNNSDIKIISTLRKNARVSLTKLSKLTSIPVSTIFDKIKFSDVINKHTTLLNFQELGYHTRANVCVKVSKKDKQSLKEYLRSNSQVNSVFRISSEFDFLFEGIFVNLGEMEDFMDYLEGKFNILDKKVILVIEDLKREEFFTEESVI